MVVWTLFFCCMDVVFGCVDVVPLDFNWVDVGFLLLFERWIDVRM